MRPASALLIVALCLSCLIRSASAQDVRETLQQAKALVESGDYARALTLMRQLALSAPNNDSVMAYAGFVAGRAESYDEGLKYALRAVALNDKVPWYYASVAFNAWNNLDVKLAREACQKAMTWGPQQLGQQNYDSVKQIQEYASDREREIVWTFDPAKGIRRDGYFYVALPTRDLPYQTVKYEVKDADEFRPIKVGDNDILLVKPLGDKPFQITARVVSHVYSFKEQMAKYSESASIPDEIKPYLGKSAGVDPQSSVVTEVASALRAENKLLTVRNIVGWIEKNIRYQVVFTESADRVIQNRVGECSGKARVFVALCRACGIPARLVWGMAHATNSMSAGDLPGLREYLRQQSNDPSLADDPNTLSTHAVAECYLPGAGWILVDPGNPKSLWRTDNRYVRVYHDYPGGDRSMPYNVAVNTFARAGAVVRFKLVELK